MSFYNAPPQQFLDELHDADVPGLFEPQMTPRERSQSIQASKRKLARVKQGLFKTQEEITARFGGKKVKDEDQNIVKLKLAPYHLLMNLTIELENQVENLQQTLAAGKLLPKGFEFGEVIFGTEETGEWFLGDDDDANRWQETMQIKRQLDEFMKQRAPLLEKQRQNKERLTRIQERLKKDTRKLKFRSRRGFILQIMIVMLIIAGVLIYVGYTQLDPLFFEYLPDSIAGSAPGLIIISVGALVLFATPVVYQGWRRQINKLEDSVKTWKEEIVSLRQDSKHIRRDYIPLNDKCKQYHQEYTELRSTFESSL